MRSLNCNAAPEHAQVSPESSPFPWRFQGPASARAAAQLRRSTRTSDRRAHTLFGSKELTTCVGRVQGCGSRAEPAMYHRQHTKANSDTHTHTHAHTHTR